MALEATHIRFALDLKEKFKIQNIGKYISGSIYPDSRYITKISRSLTHPKDYRNLKLDQGSDFEKGWLTHLMADDALWQVTKKLFSEFKEEVVEGSDLWIKYTAIKILLDIDDSTKFPIKKNLSKLEESESPNGELKNDLNFYNNISIDLYSNLKNLSIKDYCFMLQRMKLNLELVEKITNQLIEYAKDDKLIEKVSKIYDLMIKEVNNK